MRDLTKSVFTAALASLMLVSAQVSVASASDWTDPSFGIEGVSAPPLPTQASGVEAGIAGLAGVPGGAVGVLKGLAGPGYFGLVRLTEAGLPDPGFGQGGYTAPFDLPVEGINLEAQGEAVAAQADGKLVAVGFLQSGIRRPTLFNPLLVRFAADGVLDPTFGTGGVVAVRPDGPGGTILHDVAVQPDGRILAVGGRNEGSRGAAPPAGVVTAYLPNGRVDTGFGSAGRVLFKTGRERTYTALRSVEVLASGKILVAGYRSYRLFLARLRPNGTPDPSFGDGDGIVSVDLHSHSCCSTAAMALQPDGRIVVAAVGGSQGRERAFLLRFRPAGGLDRSFGGDGVVAPLRSRRLAEVAGVAIAGDGGIVTVGRGARTERNPHGATYAAFRTLPDGRPDRGFGRSGLLGISRGAQSYAGAALSLPDGRVLTGGSFAFRSEAGDRFVTSLLLARLLSSPR